MGGNVNVAVVWVDAGGIVSVLVKGRFEGRNEEQAKARDDLTGECAMECSDSARKDMLERCQEE